MRRILLAAGLLVGLVGATLGADSTVPNMPAGSTVAGTDQWYCVQGGGTTEGHCSMTQAATFAFGLVSGDITVNGSGVATLKNTGPGATGPIGSATLAPVITIDAQGRVTALTSVTISASGSGQVLHPGYVAGRWYSTLVGNFSAGTALANGSIRLYPFMVTQAITLSNIGARVTTAASGGNIQLAIYASNTSTKYPTGTALCSTASISTTTAGDVGPAACAISLTAGTLYWGAVNADATAGGTAIMQVLAAAATNAGWLIGATTQAGISGAATSGNFLIVAATAFNTWPDLTNTASPLQTESQSVGYAHLQININTVP